MTRAAFSLPLALALLAAALAALAVLMVHDTRPAAAQTGNTDARLGTLVAYSGTSAASTLPTRLTLSPAFDRDTTHYTATVDSSATHVQLFPEPVRPANVTLKAGVQGTDLADVGFGQRTAAIALSETGATAVKVRVTAENGNTKDYTIIVSRRYAVDVHEMAPRVPTSFKVEAGISTISVSWAASSTGEDPTHWDGQWKASTANEWMTVSGIPASLTTWGISPPANDVAYDVRVRGRNSHGNGPWTEARQATPRSRPGRPSVTLTPGYNSLAVSWNEQAAHLDYYRLQYREDGRSDWRNVMGVAVGTQAPIHLLKGGTAYDVRVRGVVETEAGGVTAGPWSNLARGTPLGDAVPAEIAAFGLQAVEAVGSLVLAWNEQPSTVTGFQVQYKASTAADQAATGDAATGWVDVAHSGRDTMTTIRDLSAGTMYDARVRATYASGYGFWSEVQASPRAGGL